MEEVSANRMTVEVFIDVICPYCWIGLTRLEKALAGFAHAGQVDVVARTRRLLAGATPEPSKKLIAERFGSTEKADARLEELKQLAAAEGLTYSLDRTYLGDTSDAHRVIKLAADRGLGAAVLDRIFRGFYSEEAWIFDQTNLAVMADEAGLDRVEVEQTLRGDAYRVEIQADETRFIELGGKSTPFFVMAGEPLPPGQSEESLLTALGAAWAQRGRLPAGA